MHVLAVRLTPWATKRITGQTAGRVTKQMLRQSIEEFPGTEFHTLGGANVRTGAVVTIPEAQRSGIDMLEVRTQGMDLLAAIYLTDGKVDVQ
jgi:hypothetical protein